MNQRVTMIRMLLIAASALLGLGLVGPCMTVHPSFGSFTGWVEMLAPEMTRPTTYSILGGIWSILTGDSVLLGLLLLVFSVVFPAAKLATLWWGVTVLQQGKPAGIALWITHHAGKFSMLDVMVIALIVVAIKGMPGDTRIVVEWGLFAFAGSVLLSMVVSVLVQKLEKGVKPAEAEQPTAG